MAYTPRFTQPESGNPFWTGTAYGGYNRQIIPATYGSLSAWYGSVLANCTGYVHGRWMELGGVTSEVYGISNGNASTYFSYGDGYERGQTPRLGAIACYSGGLYGGAGHVAIVEQVNADGSCVVSQSNYGISIFEVVTLPANGYNPWTAQGLVFNGFIYHPSIHDDPTYNIRVINGTPSKTSGKKGDTATITYTPRTGYTFVKWTISGGGSLSSYTSRSTTYTFGDSDATITAIEEPLYNITVINGTPVSFTGKKGSMFLIAWNKKDDYNFIRWEIDGHGSVMNARAESTYLMIGEGNATITAIDNKIIHMSKVALMSLPPVYKNHFN